MAVHVISSVRVVTHQSIELNKTYMDAIFKALSAVLNENIKNTVFTLIKQLKMREYSKDIHFSLNYSIRVIFISTFPPSLMSYTLHVVDIQFT